MTAARRSIQPVYRLLLAITAVLVLNSPGLASPSSSAGASAASATATVLTPQFVYVGNHDSKDLSVFHINAATGELSPIAGSPFPLETAPTSVVASPNGKFLFIAGDTSAAIFAYTIDSRGVPQAVEDSPFGTAESPHQLVVDHAGNRLYATAEEAGTVLAFAVDAASGKLTTIAGSPFPVGRAPSGLAIGPDDRFLFVASGAENAIFSFQINRQSGALAPTRNPAVGTGLFPERIAISASGKELYVTNAGSDSVSAFFVDPVNRALTPASGSPFETLHSPGNLLVTPDTTRLLVASSQAAGLSGMAIDLESAATGERLLAPASQIAPRGSLTLASDVAGHFLFAANADSNTVTRYLVDPQTHNPTVISGLSYATGSGPRAIAVANAASPQTTESISVSLASGSLLTFATTTGTVTLSAAAVQGSDSSCSGQVIQLAFSVPSIAVISTATENPATSVCVLTGETTASFTVTTAANSGSATLTAFATGFTDGTTTLSVSLRTITLSLPYTNIGTGNTVTGTITLANPAPTIPSPGGVTISLTSSAAATASVSPASVTIAAGGKTASFTVTGVQANTATLTASVASGGYSNGTLGVTVFPPGLTISLPHNAVVAPGQSLPYPVSIGAAATAAVSIKLVGSVGPGTVTFSPNPVIIPMGQTSPTTSPTITGVKIGPLSVTGSASGYASDTENATVQITLTFNPNTLSVETGATADLTLSASAVAPTGGFKITLNSATAEASVPISITIPAGSSSVSVPITGVAPGSTTIQATAPGAIAASAAVTVYAAPGITLYGPTGSSSFTVGYNGIVTMSGILAEAAPAGNVVVKLVTPATSNLLLSTSATAAGSHSITVTVSAGSTSIPSFYAQGTASSGSATITATATGYSNGSATATFAPSGFILEGGTTTTSLSGTSPVYVYFVQLDPTTLAYAGQTLTLRPGAPSVTVGLTNTDTPAGVGTLGASSVVLKADNSYVQTTFQPVSGGSATIGFASTPAGYSAASNDNTTTFTVTTPNTSLILCDIYSITGTGSGTMGYNSACPSSISLATAAPRGGRKVTLTSNSPNLLLSTSKTAVGSASITLTVAAGNTSSAAQFYVQALVSTGSATITETVLGYNSTTATVDFSPSGFILEGGTATTTFSGTSPVYVYFAQLDLSTLAYTGQTLTLRPGASTATVGLTNTNTPAGVGRLASSSLVFKAGDSHLQTTFKPAKVGSAVIGFSATLAGYSTPSNDATTTFTVTAPNSSLILCNIYSITGTGSGTMGYNSACASSISLATAAPKGGVTVTLTSNSSKLLLSTSATTVGSASIKLNVPADSTTAPQFYAQALASTGSPTITETASGYNSTTATVNFDPSGFILEGGTSTSTFSGTSPVYVYFAELDPTTLAYTGQTLTLRPGASAATIGLTNSNAGVGTLGASSVVFNVGDSSHQTTFQPVSPGSAVIGFSSTLAGYATPSNDATTTFTVTAPNTSLILCNIYSITGTGSGTMGHNAACASSISLATAAPTGGRTVTLTSSDTTKLLLSNSATTVGSQSITLAVAAGSTTAPQFYVQALVSTGTATITESVSGYNPTAATVNFNPSGFILQGGTTTTTFSGTSPVYVYFAQLNPTTLAYAGQTLTLRPGASAVTIGLTNTDTPAGVGTLASSSLVFNPGDTLHQTTFQPAVAGSAVIGFSATPAGYAKPSNDTTTTFTVTAPNSSLILCNIYSITGTGSGVVGYNSACASSISLAIAAPSARTVTLTSNSANLLLSTSATMVGTGSITLSVASGGTTAPQFYVQALASTGSATITETVPGYNSTTATVNFDPSGFILLGGTSTTALSAASTVYVYFAQLDPTTLAYTGQTLTLRPGASTATIGLTNTDTPAGVGTLASSSLVFNPGDTLHQTTFQPAKAGSAVIAFSATLAGYSTPSTDNTTTFTVTTPTTSVQAATVGNYMETTTYGTLQVAAPAGGVTVTITAPSRGTILLSTSASVKGNTSLSFTLAAGSSSTPIFYVQSQGGGAGTVNLTISAPGYANGTGTVTVYPSGFALQGSNFTTTLTDNPTTLTIVPAALDPMYLNIYQVQELVPNVATLLAALTTPVTPTGTLVLTVQSGTSPVGMFSVNSVTFQGDDNPNFLTSSFVPESVGTALITITSHAPFSNASTEITATVVSQ